MNLSGLQAFSLFLGFVLFFPLACSKTPEPNVSPRNDPTAENAAVDADVNPGEEIPPAEESKPKDEVRFAFDGAVDNRGLPQPWVPTVSSGKLDVAVQARSDDDPEQVIYLLSEKASYFLANRAHPFDPQQYPLLRWSWKATQLPTAGDVRKQGILFGENRNDQAVQVLVVFENKRVLSYVWDSSAPVGTEVSEPSLAATVKTRVLDSGDEFLNTWRSHEVDLLADYEHRFGEPPGLVQGILVQTNSNHTKSVGAGLISPIVASPR